MVGVLLWHEYFDITGHSYTLQRLPLPTYHQSYILIVNPDSACRWITEWVLFADEYLRVVSLLVI